jgi:hypothetical protein
MFNLIDATQVRCTWVIPHGPGTLRQVALSLLPPCAEPVWRWAYRQKPPRQDPAMPGDSQTILVATESESNDG